MGTSECASFLILYLRSRFIPYIIPAIIVVLAAATWWSFAMSPDIPNEVDREIIQRNLITSITVLAAVSLTFTLGSPWGEMDNAAGALLQRIRYGLFAIILVLVSILMVGGGTLWESSGASFMMLRNILGWVGVTLVVARFLGENQARLVSIAWAGIAIVSGDSWRVHYPPWAWSMQDGTNMISWTISFGMLVAGFYFLVRSRFPTATD